MKILYVVHDFFPKFFGGTERYVLNIAQQMQRMGNNVKVLTYGVDDSAEEFRPIGDILYRAYTFEGIPVICIRHKVVPIDQGYRIYDDLLEDARDILVKERPDVIHIAHPMRLSYVVAAAKQIGIQVVLTITDFWLICARGRFFKTDYSSCNSPEEGRKCQAQCGVDDSIFVRLRNARKLFDSVDARIAPSRFLIEIFRENGWDKPIQHINHGVDYRYVSQKKRIRQEGESIIFAYLGVVGKFKGINLLVEAFKSVTSPNIRLNIYGNCIGTDGTIDFVRNAESEDPRIKVMGRFNHDELPNILNEVDVVVVPSSTLESYGLVVVESFAYEVPVIAADMVGSAYEFIRDGENGRIFSVGNPSGLAEIIRQISEQPSLVETWRSNITLPPRLEEEVFALEKIYKSVLKK